MARYELTYPSVVESHDSMLEDLNVLLAQNGITDRIKRDFMVVVSEAFTNAMVHGNELDPAKEIKLVVIINQSGLSADILDQGRHGLERIRSRRRCSLLAESGRGIDLIKHYADSVDFAERGSGGLRVSIKLSRKEGKHTSKCQSIPLEANHGDYN